MNDCKRCSWCDAVLMGNEQRGEVCNECLSGETVCEGCGKPLRDHEGAADDGDPSCPEATDQEFLDRAARAAESRPAFIAYPIGIYRETFDLSYAEVAAALGIDRDALSVLMLCKRPRQLASYAADIADIAGNVRANPKALRNMLAFGA